MGMMQLKSILIQCFDKEIVEDYEDNYGKEGVMDLARKTAENGVYFKTPVFDGADL